MSDIEVVGVIVGVLGFVLSVAHWVFELFERRVSLSMNDTEYSIIFAGPNHRCFYIILETIISNRSTAPVSISNIQLLRSDNQPHPCEVLPVLLLEKTKKNKDGAEKEKILSTPLPVFLQGRESAFLRIAFRIPTTDKDKYPLPPFDNPKGLLLMNSHLLKPSNRVEWHYHIRVNTSRRMRQMEGTARFYQFFEKYTPEVL